MLDIGWKYPGVNDVKGTENISSQAANHICIPNFHENVNLSGNFSGHSRNKGLCIRQRRNPVTGWIVLQCSCGPSYEALEYAQYVPVVFRAAELEIAMNSITESLDDFFSQTTRTILPYDSVHLVFQFGIIITAFDIAFP